jgi:hypothetical protein
LTAWSIGLALGGGARQDRAGRWQPVFDLGVQTELLHGPRKRSLGQRWWGIGPVVDLRFNTPDPDRWQVGGGLEVLGQFGNLGVFLAGGVDAAFPGPEPSAFGTLGVSLRDWLPLGACSSGAICIRPTPQLAVYLDARHGLDSRSTQVTAGCGEPRQPRRLVAALVNGGWGGENFPVN